MIIKAPPDWDPTFNHIKSLGKKKDFHQTERKRPRKQCPRIQLPITLNVRGEMHVKRKGNS